MYGTDLDSSYNAVLHAAFLEGWQFGRTIVFTYGPFGFLFHKTYHPSTYPVAIVAWLALGAAFWWGASRAVRESGIHPVVGFAYVAVVLLFAGATFDEFFLALGALLLVSEFHADGRSAAPVLASALALATLTKFSFAILAVVVVGAVTVADALARRVPASAISYSVSLAAFWLLAGQSPFGVWSFLATSVEVARTYSEAMALDGPWIEILAFLVPAAALLAVVARLAWREPPARSIPATLGLAALLFLTFKAAFVRQDAHVVIGYRTLLLVAALYAPALWTRRPSRTVRAVVAFVLVASVAAVWVAAGRHFGASSATLLARALGAAAHRTISAGPTLLGRAPHHELYDLHQTRARVEFPVPAIRGTVDTYPVSQAVALAHGLSYRPRPVIQSYAAHSEALAELNAAHLRSADAPASLLFDIAPTDGRYPSLEDGPSWPDLLTRYDVADATRHFLVLARSPEPRSHRLVPIESASARLGEPVAVPAPAGGPVWARVTVDPTAAGTFAATLARSPVLRITVRLRGGDERAFRVVPGMARGGFLLSPLVEDRLAFALLSDERWRSSLATKAVESVTVDAESGAASWCYAPRVRVEFLALEFPHRNVGAVAAFEALSPLLDLASNAVASGAPVELRVGPARRPVLFAHAPSELHLPVAAGAKLVEVDFGLLEGAWSDGGATDGVEFRVSARGADGTRLLWSQVLAPVEARADRGRQHVEIPLEGIPPGTLVFETLPRGSSAWDWAYWAGATVR
jgi:hypothetical protein